MPVPIYIHRCPSAEFILRLHTVTSNSVTTTPIVRTSLIVQIFNMRLQSLKFLLFSALAFHVENIQACGGKQKAGSACVKPNAGACDINNKHNIVSRPSYPMFIYG